MTSPGEAIEQGVEQAHLLLVRGDSADAERLLLELRRRYGRVRDVEMLLQQIDARRYYGKQDDEKRREWRYWLGLQTGWQRFGWWCAAAGLALIGLYLGIEAFVVGFSQGFGAMITTYVPSGSRYNSRMVPWTRPAYEDLLYAAVFIAAGVGIAVFLRVVTRGAAQWEELDAPDPQYHGPYGF